jgi:ABC-2 type transport system ATP-binding protein
MCTHVAIIHKGVLQFQGDMNSLRQSAEGKTVKLKISNTEQWKNTISEKFPHLHWNKNGELIASINELSEVSQLNSTLVQAGVPIVSIQPSGGLEEWFVQMTKN